MWYTVMPSLLGAVVSSTLFAGYWLLRHGYDVSFTAAAEVLGAVALGGALSGAAVSLALRPRHLHSSNASRTLESVTTKRRRRALRARLTPELRWLALTPALHKALGHKAERLHGKSFLLVVHPEDIALVDAAFQGALAGNTMRTGVIRLLSPRPEAPRVPARKQPFSDTAAMPTVAPSQVRHVRLCVRPHFDARGIVSELRCAFVDRSLLANAELALGRCQAELSQARRRLQRLSQDLDRLKESYRDLYHNAPVMYFSLDVEGRLVTFNDTLVRTLGYQRDELTGRSYHDLLAPQVRPTRDQRVRGTGKGAHGGAVHDEEVETLWRTKSGADLDIWIRSVPVLDERGHFVRSRSAALDLTERNRLAHELRTRGDELERTNSRLRLINAELEDFTHVVSHDLKEPLRTLQAYSNILAEDFSGQLGPDGFQYINHLIQASRRLGNLIDDLLALGQAGRIKGAKQVFNLIEVVATVRNDLVGLIQRKEATVLTEGSLPTVTGDQHRITQLLTNLVTNGLKYNNHVAPQVVIGHSGDIPAPGAPDDIDPTHAVISVRDNGIGIDAPFHGRIFGIFQRLHQAGEYEGTGAGLAICKKIVEAHGGRLWVDSKLGEGATFYFTLPQLPDVADASNQRNGRGGTVAPAHRDNSPRRAVLPAEHLQQAPPAAAGLIPVVLVEDMVDIALIIQRLGRKSGLAVTYFTNAEDAWKYLQGHEPELLLLDINLPGMSGIDLCKKIRVDLGRTSVPIVLFSPEKDPELLQPLHAAGATYVMSKDLLIEPARWQQKLQEIVHARQQAHI